jgi:thiosulfate reductase cytochrome b subunit
MKRILSVVLALVALAVAGRSHAQQSVNPIHPPFAPLASDGSPARQVDAVSAEKTCGACHHATTAAKTGAHAGGHATATCLDCHVDGGKLPVDPVHLGPDGKVQREDLRIGRPKAQNCARCHGLIEGAGAAVLLPPDLEATLGRGPRTWSLTLGEGAVVSPSHMSESLMNLEGKAELAAPWDVHASKLVDCVGCHFAPNDPAHSDARAGDLAYLQSDPRRVSIAEFLLQPDHHLTAADCRSCHAPLAAHDFLPYAERHMKELACTACHAPGPMGPAAEMVDATAVTADGSPLVRWRNVDRRPGESLDAATVHPLRPLLVMRPDATGTVRLTPVNLVSRFRWVSGPDRAEVPFETVAKAWLEGGRVAPAVVRALDTNHDGTLDDAERRLDTTAKAGVIAARLRAAGVVDPVIDGELEVHPLAHGIPGRHRAVRACAECHGGGGRLSGQYPIAEYLPGGYSPRLPSAGQVDLSGAIVPTATGGLTLDRSATSAPAGMHILGRSRQAITNTIGFSLFLAVAFGLAVHGATRVVLSWRRRRTAHELPVAVEREYVFGRYERIWHWTMAGAGITLIATGLVIHSATRPAPFGLESAVVWHNGAAVVLMLNAFLSLFYHLATAAIRNFIPAPQGLLRRMVEHFDYQSRGIFYGRPHPANAPDEKLNPLQQLTYLALLNVLFPLQIATGVFMWAVGHWPALGGGMGGLVLLAPLHNLGAWLLVTFFVLHVYLVTTGRTLGEHVTAMVTGYRPADDASMPKGA